MLAPRRPTSPLVRLRRHGDGDIASLPQLSALGWVRLVAPAATITFGLSGFDAARRPLQGDDFATWYAADLPLPQLAALLDHIDLVHGLYYLLMHAWIGLVGDSALLLRLPSILAVTLTAVAVTGLGRRLFGASAGLFAGLLYALTPAVTHYGTEVRAYGLVSLLAVVSTIGLLRALDLPTWWRWSWYAATVLLTGVLHFVSLLVLCAHLVVVLSAVRLGRRAARRWYLVTAVVLLAMVPLLVKARTQAFAVAGHSIDRRDVIFFTTSLTQSWQVKILILTSVLMAVVIGYRIRPQAVLLLVTWLLAPPIGCLLLYPAAPIFAPRYLTFTFPAWTVLAGAAWAEVRLVAARSGLRLARVRVTAIGLVVAMVLAGLQGQIKVHTNQIIGVPDLTGAARYVRRHWAPGDAIAYGAHWPSAGPGLARQFNRYAWRGRPQPPDVFVSRTSEQAHLIDPIECKTVDECRTRLAGIDRVWLETAAPAGTPLDGAGYGPAVVLGADFVVIAVTELRGVRLVLLQRRMVDTADRVNHDQ